MGSFKERTVSLLSTSFFLGATGVFVVFGMSASGMMDVSGGEPRTGYGGAPQITGLKSAYVRVYFNGAACRYSRSRIHSAA